MSEKDIAAEVVATKILLMRGRKVMLDRDLAQLYGVTTGVLNQAVKRNRSRFPEDFMFQLKEEEFSGLISQFVISKRGGTRKLPYVFTEQGVAMLSTVLNSERAIQVNILKVKVNSRVKAGLFSRVFVKKLIPFTSFLFEIFSSKTWAVYLDNRGIMHNTV